jgi:hypothetical protein
MPSSSLSELSTRPFPSMMRAAKNEQLGFYVLGRSGEEPPEHSLLLPLPEELPPLKEAHDMRNAVLWFAGMLFCLVLLLGHGLV